MTEETTTETTEVQPEPEAKGLRAQNDQLRKENRELKAGKRDDTIASIGLNVDSGLGMALAEQFDSGNLKLDDIATTAVEKYGHVVPEVAPVNPVAQQIEQSHQALDNLQGAAGSLAPPTQQDELARAESEKNFDKSIAMKSAQIGEMLRSK